MGLLYNCFSYDYTNNKLNFNSDNLCNGILSYASGEFESILTNGLNSIFDKLSEKIDASIETAQHKREIKKTEKELEKLKTESEKEIQAKIEEIKAQKELIDNENKTLQDYQIKMLGNQGLIGIEQKLVDSNITILNDNSDGDQSKKQKAFKTIQDSQNRISGYVSESTNWQQIITDSSSNVATYSANIAQLEGEITTTSMNAANEITNKEAKLADEEVDNAKIINDGKIQSAKGEIQIEEAEALGATSTITLGATAVVATEQLAEGLNNIKQGGTRMTEGAKNLTAVSEIIGGLGENYASLSNLTGQAASASREAITSLGTYENTVASSITAIGSWETFAPNNANLLKAINDYSEQTGMKTETSEYESFMPFAEQREDVLGHLKNTDKDEENKKEVIFNFDASNLTFG